MLGVFSVSYDKRSLYGHGEGCFPLRSFAQPMALRRWGRKRKGYILGFLTDKIPLSFVMPTGRKTL